MCSLKRNAPGPPRLSIGSETQIKSGHGPLFDRFGRLGSLSRQGPRLRPATDRPPMCTAQTGPGAACAHRGDDGERAFFAFAADFDFASGGPSIGAGKYGRESNADGSPARQTWWREVRDDDSKTAITEIFFGANDWHF